MKLSLPTPLRDLAFRRFWFGQTISLFGDQITLLALPLAAVLVLPDRLRARFSGAYTFVNYGVRPLGSLVGGLLGSTIGLRPTLWIGAAGAIAGGLFLLPSPMPHIHALPETAEESV